MSDQNETMIYAAECAEYKVEEKDGRITLVGYPIVWGAMSDVRKDGNRHRFAKGSVEFAKPTKAVVNHEKGQLVGNTANNTLRLSEDDHGVRAEIDVPNTTLGRDTAQLVKDGYITGMSTGGYIKESKVGNGVRDIVKFKSYEVTITDDPAMDATSIAVMSTGYAAEYEKEQAENKNLEREKEIRAQMSKLNKYRLAQYKLGKVSGSTSHR